MQNGFCGSFNGRILRDGLLNQTLFIGLLDVRSKITAWITDDNPNRPHSALGYLTPTAYAANLPATCGLRDPYRLRRSHLATPALYSVNCRGQHSFPLQPLDRRMVTAPFGSWSSPITSDIIVGDAIILGQIALDGNAIYWGETQPKKHGRTFIYCVNEEHGEAKLITPYDGNDFNARTSVHEYGGGAFAVKDGTVYFSNFADQRLYRQDPGQQPRPITSLLSDAEVASRQSDAETEKSKLVNGLRYADGVIDSRRGRVICVREEHIRSGEVINTLVGVDILGARPQQLLLSGNDFYSTPRLI